MIWRVPQTEVSQYGWFISWKNRMDDDWGYPPIAKVRKPPYIPCVFVDVTKSRNENSPICRWFACQRPFSLGVSQPALIDDTEGSGFWAAPKKQIRLQHIQHFWDISLLRWKPIIHKKNTSKLNKCIKIQLTKIEDTLVLWSLIMLQCIATCRTRAQNAMESCATDLQVLV